MRRRQGEKSAYILGLLALGALALTFQLGAVSALASCGSGTTLDTDCDGFIDSVETNPNGITLTGMLLTTAKISPTIIPKCGLNPTPADRANCVDPNTQDLFVIIQRATTGSNIAWPPYDTTSYIDPLALVYPGLGVATHELKQTGTSQTVDGWVAVKIVENLTPTSSYMGLAKFGVPYSGSSATVWTEKIKNWIATTCSQACFDLNGDGVAETCYTPTTSGVGSFTCMNGNPNSTTSINMHVANPDLSKLNSEFIQYVVSHETSHMMNLAYGSRPTGGTTADHHYTTLKGVLMEQFIGTTVTIDASKNIVVSLYLSSQYALPQDATQHKLR